jgi:hypothetical protein
MSCRHPIKPGQWKQLLSRQKILRQIDSRQKYWKLKEMFLPKRVRHSWVDIGWLSKMEKRQSSTSGANVMKHFIIDDVSEKVVRVLGHGKLFSA